MHLKNVEVVMRSQSLKRRSMLVLAAMLMFGVACSSFAAWPQKTEQDFRQMIGGGTQPLVFRDTEGRTISREEFVRLLNSDKRATIDVGPGEDVAVFTIEISGLKKPPAGMKSALHDGDQIPQFTLTSLDGESYSNQQLRSNKLTLVNFFFVECGNCIAEIPVMNDFKAEHPEIPTVAITYDPAVAAQAYVRRWHLHWQVVPNAVRFTDQVGIWQYPMFALVDGQGRLVAMSGGWDMHKPGKHLTADDIARWVAAMSSQRGAHAS